MGQTRGWSPPNFDLGARLTESHNREIAQREAHETARAEELDRPYRESRFDAARVLATKQRTAQKRKSVSVGVAAGPRKRSPATSFVNNQIGQTFSGKTILGA